MYFVRYGSDGDGGSGFLGNGIWKKSSDSNDFQHLTSTAVSGINNDPSSDWSCINQIVTDPSNPSRVYAATSAGLQISDDGVKIGP